MTATDRLKGDETILTDYAARRMDAHVGDSVTMDYYVSRGGLKQLETRSHRFHVSRIVPLSEFRQQAELLTADFPGLSGVQRCTDWDSDLPIDMSRITRADEDYWAEYRQLPKAMVSLDAVGSDWTGAYGVATKVVVNGESAAALSPQSFGIVVVQPREAALQAALNGTDFGLLFLALGFFIILAAILLMQNPLAEMYQLRRSELQLFSVMGFSRRQVFCRLFAEALPIVLTAAPVGVLLGYAYVSVILWLLGGPWSGATQTGGFALHAHPLTVLLSLAVAVLLALAVLALTVRTAVNPRAQQPSCPASASRLSHVGLALSNLRYYRRQHRLSFWSLALGVLVVFAVGLNRPDFMFKSEEVTGGYQLYGESRIPIQYDLNTAAGRHHLHLDGLPADVSFLQLSKHTEDEASCLNLNRVATPSVIGMPPAAMPAFGIDTTRFSISDIQFSIFPVAVDEEALMWSMMCKVGDTLTYHASDGREVKAVIAASYPTGVLHGHAVMPFDCFTQLWPDETGSRIVLVNEASRKGDEVSVLNTSLSDYGVSFVTTAERLQAFLEVTDTYLQIFLSLGGLGLLLGLVSLFVIVRKNLTARRQEIGLYRTIGFSTAHIVSMLRREQLVVPLLAIVAGVLGSVLISLILPTSSLLQSRITAAVLLLSMLLFTFAIIYISINPKTIKQCETS